MRNKRWLAIFTFFILFVSSLFAQEDWFYGKTIKKITFDGLKSLTSTDLSYVTNDYIGQEFSDELYSDILSKLFSLEYFDNISTSVLPADTENSACILNFIVEERPIITSLKFTGNKKVSATELREVISIKKGDIYIQSTIILDERRIRELYLQKGYTNVRVASEMTETENGVDLIFSITEGKPTIVKSIEFRGNDVVTSKTLRNTLSMKEASLFQKGAFQETMLEADRQTILAYYQNRGYIDATITDILREVSYNEDKDQDELTIIFDIREGSEFSYGGLEISGNTVFSTEELLSLMTLKEGAVFNQAKFVASIQAICDLYYENGYTSNQFYPNYVRDTEKNSIVCHLTIYEFPKSHIENIIVKGNEKTKDYVILREIPIESGDIFSKFKVENGLRNLYNTQYFSAIVPEFVPGSEQNLVDMIVTVEEGPTSSVEFGVTFTGITNPNDSPISGFIKWSDTNVGGTGRTVSTSVIASNSEQSISLSYGDSWFLGKPISISASLDFSHANAVCLQNVYLPNGLNSTDFYMNYDKWTFGGGISVGKRWLPAFAMVSLSGGLNTSFIRNSYDASIYTPASSVISDNHGRFGIENTLWANISLDDRDIYYDPSKGWFASQKISLVGLLPEMESEYYLRSDTKGEIYFTLLDKPLTETFTLKFVLAGYSGLSLVYPTFSEKMEDGYLYVDGMFNGRGWNSMEVYQNKGNAMWSSYLELRMPIATGIFALDFFADAVAIKDTPSDLFTNLTLDDFYFSFGPGMRFSLPQFPIRLMLANTFKFEDNVFEWDRKWQFMLSFNLANR